MQRSAHSLVAPLFLAASLVAVPHRSWGIGVNPSLSTAATEDDKGKSKKDKGKKDKDDKKGEKPKDGKTGNDEGNSPSTADCRLQPSRGELQGLSEASGIAVSRRTPGTLWSHGDSHSGSPVLFALDNRGVVKGRIQVEGVKTADWEDVAVGTCGKGTCLYIADIGDNQVTRNSITVYRVPEPLPTDKATGPAEAFHATFPDGPKDAEAMFVGAAGEIYVVSKGDAGPVALYRFPTPLKAGTTPKLEKVGVLREGRSSKEQWVTGAGASSDGKWVALRTHAGVLFYEVAKLTRGDSSAPLRFDLSGLNEFRGEGVALGPDGSVYLVGEGGKKGSPGSFSSGVCKLP